MERAPYKDELAAKRARLAEIKRQRELRQKEFSASKQPRDSTDIVSPIPSRPDRRKDVDAILDDLLGTSRPSSAGPRDPSSPAGHKASRPTSVVSGGQLSGDNSEITSPPPQDGSSKSTQPLSFAPLTTVYEVPSSPKPVNPPLVTYSKAVQTAEEWSPPRQKSMGTSISDDERSPSPERSPRSKKRLSRREKEQREEELRQKLRREIEDEMKSALKPGAEDRLSNGQLNYPARPATTEELNAITSSDDFFNFVERSSKVIERALDEEYDVLVNYASGGIRGQDEDDEDYDRTKGKKGRRVKEVAQFWDERWSKRRMISSLGFSPKFPELVLASYTKNSSAPHDPDGLVQVWNLHMRDRPEYMFHAQSDILVAKFSPFHPNLIVGGAYSGQVLLWDTRAKPAPVQKTPLTGSGHTHPVYSLDIVGTQNANNIISCSTDGVVCGWSVDMLSQPQEYLELTTPPPAKTDDLAPTCVAFPQADPTYFLAGTEEGTIYPCHRYERAGAKAGVDTKVAYKGHSAPVMSLDFHSARGPIDLGDLVLSSSIDWSVKLWKARPPAASIATGAIGGNSTHIARPLLEIIRDDLVYDARWSPVRPGVFALVDGAGSLEFWDLHVDVEVPLAKVTPSKKFGTEYGARSLNKVAWEVHEGKRVCTGGLDGVLTVFEVGSDLGGLDGARSEEWTGVKKLVNKLDAVGLDGVNGKSI